MSSKLQALLPLLGWFYLTIFGFAIVSWILGKRSRLFQRIYYAVFGAYALFLAIQGLSAEASLWKETRKSLMDTFRQKIIYETGTYYEMYYENFRKSAVHFSEIVLKEVPTREYYYARTYLYPSVPLQRLEISTDPGTIGITSASTPSSLPNFSMLVKKYNDKYFFRIGDWK